MRRSSRAHGKIKVALYGRELIVRFGFGSVESSVRIERLWITRLHDALPVGEAPGQN